MLKISSIDSVFNTPEKKDKLKSLFNRNKGPPQNEKDINKKIIRMVTSYSWMLIAGPSLLQIKFEEAKNKTDKIEFSFDSFDHNCSSQKMQDGESLTKAQSEGQAHIDPQSIKDESFILNMTWSDALNLRASIFFELEPIDQFSHPVIKDSNREDFIGTQFFKGYLATLALSSHPGQALVKHKYNEDWNETLIKIGDVDSSLKVII